jgi:hypothetical protein
LYSTLAGFDAGINGLYATLREERAPCRNVFRRYR